MKRKFLLYILIGNCLGYYCAAQQQQPDTAYQLPDVLTSQSGKKIDNKTNWEKSRRAEILNLFEKNVQGKTPTKKIALHFKTMSVNGNSLNGTATRKEVRVYFSNDSTYFMDILFYIPNRKEKPSPLFLGLNFSGNQTIHADSGITITKRWVAYGDEPAFKDHYATAASRGTADEAWPVEQIIAAGYGLGTIYYGDLQPDSANSINAGIAPLLYANGQTKPAADEWGAIGVWAWGLSRAMDYIETDKDLDAKKTIVIGHSRLGKTALWAGAQDNRFAMVISNNSGEGGAAITRRKYGETIDVMNKAFPHWFSDNFKLYNKNENNLPVDFHEMIALIAPRPVYIASATEDQWADPEGEYLSAYYAGAVYALYRLKGLPGSKIPKENSPVGDGSIGYHLRKGKHALTAYDWQQYLHFADRFFKLPR